jgi:hypothetical protein
MGVSKIEKLAAPCDPNGLKEGTSAAEAGANFASGPTNPKDNLKTLQLTQEIKASLQLTDPTHAALRAFRRPSCSEKSVEENGINL